MERSIFITLHFINKATAPMQAAVGFISGAVSKIKNFFTDLATHMKWASFFFGTMAMVMASKVVGMAAEIEQTRTAFETLLGSAEKAGKMMEWLAQYSLVTPLQREQLYEATRTLLAYGHSAEEAKKGLQAVVEATSALGISETRLNTITYNLGQLYKSTTARYRELRDLQLQGIDTAKLLAQAVNDGMLKLTGYGKGATVAAGATKELTKAAAKAKEVIEDTAWKTDKLKAAVEKAKKKYGESSYQYKEATDKLNDWNEKVAQATGIINKYTEAESKRGQTITYVSKNLTTLTREQEELILQMNTGKQIALALEEQMLKTYGGAALRQVKTLSGLISNFHDIMSLVFSDILGMTASGEIRQGSIFFYLREGAAQLSEFLIAHRADISNFLNQFLAMKPVMVGLATFLIGMLIPAFFGLIGPLLLAGAIFGTLGATIYIFYERLKDLGIIDKITSKIGTWIETVKSAGGISGIFGSVLDDLKKQFASFVFEVAGIQSPIPPTWEMAAELLRQKVIEPIGQEIQNLKDKFVFGEVISPVPATWMDVWVKIQDILKTVGDVMMTVLRPAWDQVKISLAEIIPLFGQLWEALEPLLVVFAQVAAVILMVGAALLSGILTMLPQVIAGVMQFATGLIQIITGLFTLFIGIITLNGELIKQAFHNIWQGILNIFEGFKSLVFDSVNGFINGIINFFKGLYNALVGKSIIPEMVEAIINWFGDLKDKAFKIVGDIVNGIKSRFEGLVGAAWNWGVGIIRNIIEGLKSAVRGAGKLMGRLLGEIGLSYEELMRMQHGGIVPGPIGAPVPIIAHGGERIVPRTGANVGMVGGGLTVNVNLYGGVTLDSESRIYELADRIGRILGRQNELARYGAGF